MSRRLHLIGGEFGGHSLRYPREVKIRPTAERVRESLFSSLGPYLEGARFADLFAGTGAVGLEALSRGASLSVFVENNYRCVEAIEANVAKVGVVRQAIVVAGAVEAEWPRVARQYGPFDLVFLDPPYTYRNWDGLLDLLLRQQAGVGPKSLVIIQHTRQQPPEAPLPAWHRKAFGETQLTWYRLPQAEGENQPDA